MPNLDDLMEYLIVTNQVDETFGLKPTCPSCGEPLEKSGDLEYPYYCPSCGKKTRTKVYEDTVLICFPLYCPKCGTETIIDVMKFEYKISAEPDA